MPVLYLIRHGETDFNIAQRLQGHYETALNARGCAQARDSATVLHELFDREGRRVDEFAYISSPLKRATQTMEIVRAGLGLDPLGYAVDDRLMEISYGEWEGSTLAEIEARDSDTLLRRERDKWDFAPPGGESYRSIADRVGACCASLTRDTVVTAHGGVIRSLMANFHIVPKEEAVHANILHGAVYVFSAGTLACYANSIGP